MALYYSPQTLSSPPPAETLPHSSPVTRASALALEQGSRAAPGKGAAKTVCKEGGGRGVGKRGWGRTRLGLRPARPTPPLALFRLAPPGAAERAPAATAGAAPRTAARPRLPPRSPHPLLLTLPSGSAASSAAATVSTAARDATAARRAEAASSRARAREVPSAGVGPGGAASMRGERRVVQTAAAAAHAAAFRPPCCSRRTGRRAPHDTRITKLITSSHDFVGRAQHADRDRRALKTRFHRAPDRLPAQACASDRQNHQRHPPSGREPGAGDRRVADADKSGGESGGERRCSRHPMRRFDRHMPRVGQAAQQAGRPKRDEAQQGRRDRERRGRGSELGVPRVKVRLAQTGLEERA